MRLNSSFLSSRIDARKVLLDRPHHALVRIGFRHVEQLGSLVECDRHLVERGDDSLELAALAAQFLRAFGLGPDGRVFELPQDFSEPLGLASVVKGTP